MVAAPVQMDGGGGRVHWRGRGRQACYGTPQSPWLQTSSTLETSYIVRERRNTSLIHRQAG